MQHHQRRWLALGEMARADRGIADHGALGENEPDGAGFGFLGEFLSHPKIVVVESNPGSEATRTAAIRSCAHSLVESGHLPDTTKPLRDPREWNGAISIARPDPKSISPPGIAELWPDTPVGR